MGMWNSIESVGDLATRIDVVEAGMPLEAVAARLERTEAPAVAVAWSDGELGLLTRGRIDAVTLGLSAVPRLAGKLTGRIAGDYAIRTTALPGSTSVTIAVDRFRELEDLTELLVALDDGGHGLVTGAVLLEHLSSHYVHRALHDPLTGLPNRVLLEERIAHLREHRDRAERTVILFIDLDGFKDVNDEHGHDVGDQLLVEVAARLLETVRDHDTVARIGGDEFVVLLEDLDRPGAADVIAERMLERIEQPTRAGDVVLYAGASIGIAHIADQRDDVDQMLQRADEAMYRAKRQSVHSIVWWDDADSWTQRRARIAALRHAVEHGLIEVWFQPKLAPWNWRLQEVEALARWQYRAQWVPPSEFIPMAREQGFITDLGMVVLERSCAAVAAINAVADDPITLAVNMTREELAAPTLLGDVVEVLARTGLDPRTLRIEVDEHELPSPLGRVADALFELTELGIRLSLGGFGSGYDSLIRLTELPVSEVKLDQSLLTGHRRPRAAALARMVVAAAHELGAHVTAERVETEAEVRFVASIDCDLVQGFHSGKPMRQSDFDLYARTELGGRRPSSGGSAAGRRDW